MDTLTIFSGVSGDLLTHRGTLYHLGIFRSSRRIEYVQYMNVTHTKKKHLLWNKSWNMSSKLVRIRRMTWTCLDCTFCTLFIFGNDTKWQCLTDDTTSTSTLDTRKTKIWSGLAQTRTQRRWIESMWIFLCKVNTITYRCICIICIIHYRHRLAQYLRILIHLG